ncbi:hypothetical protein [Spirilliplanes yamanashiensis]|uniref:Uncharacterized protein n=1 Tax=Spirilliplanes yamanashiensis TaxID=42233 RepID=A0A8J3YBD6_9ACTN|nr:hypothetical protein [Spirilliplanes yamanashiensis]MDP9817955.1 hypothetical protein [Spirilliplanes yamanashiensis]GIJ04764.1 hypothetical protein Sya03_41160 [Spirilliplanes yamanashiensis]
MTWLALRLLRPYLLVAAAVTAACLGYVGYAAGVVQGGLDAAEVPGCLDPNVCYPQGAALDAVLGLELVAAFAPALLGLILGVGTFAPAREQDTEAFVLTQSVSRRRWVLTTFGWALAAAVLCAGSVAAAHRLVATRYTVLANDTYELLQLLHVNSPGFMTAQAVVAVTLAGLVGLGTGRTLRTLVATAAGTPFAVMAASLVAALLLYPLTLLTGAPEPGGGSFTDDISALDPFGYLVAAVVAAGAAAAVLVAPRVGVRGGR